MPGYRLRTRVLLVAAGLALTGLLAPGLAQARRFPASRLQLDLERGAWVEAGIQGGQVGADTFGVVALDARASLLPWVAVRVSTSALGIDSRYAGWPTRQDAWLGRSWLGAEVFHGWKLGEQRLALGASLEVGTATYGLATIRPLLESFEEPPAADGRATRARAGASLGDRTGYVQVELVKVRADEPAPGDGFVLPRSADREAGLALLSGGVRLDEWRVLSFDALLTDDDRFSFSAGYWAALKESNPLAARTSVGVRVMGGEDVLVLGVSLLHQR